MIYVVGDTHGDQYQWVEQIEPVLSAGDKIIVCGDFGIGFWNGKYWSENTFFDYLSTQSYQVLFIDGNHENFDKLTKYDLEKWCGGKVHKIRHNIIHLIRGEIYNIENKTFFVMGGGYSIDKYRRKEGINWWAQEMPSDKEYEQALYNLKDINQIDYIITHTAPSETVYYLSTLKHLAIKDDVVEEFPLTTFLDQIQRQINYKHWYFGHFHIDLELWRNQTVIFNMIRELESSKIIHQWK